jgi:uncharacterized protein (TIGR04168 family)
MAETPTAADFGANRGSGAQATRIALIGDVHSAWDRADVVYFNHSAYPLLLVTGDLGGSRARDGVRVAGSLAFLTRPTLVMPGNNDAPEYSRIAAELTYRRARADLLDDLTSDAAPIAIETPRLCGYSVHPLELDGLALSVIAARPFAMGGAELAYPELLAQHFGVHSMAESIERLCELVKHAPTEHLVFFGHNGPTGVGSRVDDPWGRDFQSEAGDWGDPDLAAAVRYAREHGRRPLAVVAGHMHWALRDQPQRLRRWQLQKDGVLYVNAARVPRVWGERQRTLRQHIALEFSASGASAHEVVYVDPVSEAPRPA